MVTSTTIKLSNSDLRNQSPLVCVFVGATSGIGLNALKDLAKNGNAPKVYIVGRSREKATAILTELKSLNPKGTFEFIEAQVSLLRDVEAACKEIKEKEKYIDLLFLSPGGLNLAGRQETTEGIDIMFSISYHARMRFAVSLLPLLNASPNFPRVVSVLGAGTENKINVADFNLKENYSLVNEAIHSGTMGSMVLEKLAAENPNISFVHTYPGFVNTDLVSKMFGGMIGFWSFLGVIAQWTLVPILNLASTSVEQAGALALFEATNSMYKGEGKKGGFYRVGSNGDILKESTILENYKTDGTQDKVWQQLMDDFDRISAMG